MLHWFCWANGLNRTKHAWWLLQLRVQSVKIHMDVYLTHVHTTETYERRSTNNYGSSAHWSLIVLWVISKKWCSTNIDFDHCLCIHVKTTEIYHTCKKGNNMRAFYTWTNMFKTIFIHIQSTYMCYHIAVWNSFLQTISICQSYSLTFFWHKHHHHLTTNIAMSLMPLAKWSVFCITKDTTSGCVTSLRLALL